MKELEELLSDLTVDNYKDRYKQIEELINKLIDIDFYKLKDLNYWTEYYFDDEIKVVITSGIINVSDVIKIYYNLFGFKININDIDIINTIKPLNINLDKNFIQNLKLFPKSYKKHLEEIRLELKQKEEYINKLLEN